jgi:hypothetical protein
MRIYRCTTDYEATEITCGEAVKRLKDNNGDTRCFGTDEFILREGWPPWPFRDNGYWLQAQRPNKKLIVLKRISESRKMLAI